MRIAYEVRAILGGNVVTLDHPPFRHANNLENVRPEEGHTLAPDDALTVIPAFR